MRIGPWLHLRWFAIIVIGLVIVISPSSVMAHTGLASSTPTDGDVLTEPLSEITMEFNTEVEPLSSFKLKDAEGDEIETEPPVVDGNRMHGNIKGPLTDGEYNVEWKIVGRDGHPIEGAFRFTVDAEEEGNHTGEPQVESPSQAEEQAPVDAPADNAEETRNEAATTEPAAEITANPPSHSIILGMIAVLTVMAIGYMVTGRGRSR